MKSKIIAALFIFLVSISVPCVNVFASIPFSGLDRDVPTLAPMLKKALPAVVNISTSGKVKVEMNPMFNDPVFQNFMKNFGLPNIPGMPGAPNAPVEKKTQSIGSGVVIDASRGYILTNHHVIKNADVIYVNTHNGKKLEAKIIGSDTDTDIAVLQVPVDVTSDLISLPLGDSENLEVGDFVVAIGNPFGIGQTATTGIISALGRSGLGIEGYEDFIQTDASINPGNSGGALINLKGELIGVNTAILSQSGTNVGIGFAIPINMVKQVTQQLIDHGEIKRGQIGIHIQDVTNDLADALSLDSTNGALVAKVVDGSPADMAGIKDGDVITAINNKNIKNAATLRNIIGLMQVGDKVNVEILRNGSVKKLLVVIGKNHGEVQKLSRNLEDDGNFANQDNDNLNGASFSNIVSNDKSYTNVHGVMVTGVTLGSPAWNAGLRAGDIVTSVNNIKIRNTKELVSAAKLKQHGIVMNITRGNAVLFIVIS